MKVIIEQSIRLETTNPRFTFVRHELNRVGVNFNVVYQPMSAGEVGKLFIIPQVVAIDVDDLECVMDAIKRFHASGDATICLQRESYLSYVLKIS